MATAEPVNEPPGGWEDLQDILQETGVDWATTYRSGLPAEAAISMIDQKLGHTSRG